MADALEYVDRQFARLMKNADSIQDANHQAFVRSLCDAGMKVNSQEGKLAAYALAVAAMEGPEGLHSFLGLVGEWITRETRDDPPQRAN